MNTNATSRNKNSAHNKRQFKKLCDKTVIDEALIPKQTPYCYSIDRERIKTDKTLEPGELPIITCPYYIFGKGEQRGCVYERFYGSDLLLWDQCKICDK